MNEKIALKTISNVSCQWRLKTDYTPDTEHGRRK